MHDGSALPNTRGCSQNVLRNKRDVLHHKHGLGASNVFDTRHRGAQDRMHGPRIWQDWMSLDAVSAVEPRGRTCAGALPSAHVDLMQDQATPSEPASANCDESAGNTSALVQALKQQIRTYEAEAVQWEDMRQSLCEKVLVHVCENACVCECGFSENIHVHVMLRLRSGEMCNKYFVGRCVCVLVCVPMYREGLLLCFQYGRILIFAGECLHICGYYPQTSICSSSPGMPVSRPGRRAAM